MLEFIHFFPKSECGCIGFIINSSYLQDYPPVPSVGFDLSTGRDVKSFLYCCVLKKVEGRGRWSAVVSLHWICFRTFLIGGFSGGRC